MNGTHYLYPISVQKDGCKNTIAGNEGFFPLTTRGEVDKSNARLWDILQFIESQDSIFMLITEAVYAS